jgi:hypothetical protein
MRYVLRDAAGTILSLHREPVPGGQPLPIDHPEVRAFLNSEDVQRSFSELDSGLVRVLEDLIDVLIERNVLRITDLPAEAQQKLFDRKHFRSLIGEKSLQLFGAELDQMGQDGGMLSDLMGLPPTPPRA